MGAAERNLSTETEPDAFEPIGVAALKILDELSENRGCSPRCALEILRAAIDAAFPELRAVDAPFPTDRPGENGDGDDRITGQP